MDLEITSTQHTGTASNIFGSEVGMVKPSHTVTIDAADLAAGDIEGDAFPGVLPAGFPLGKVTASGKYAKYNDANVDGTEVMRGVLGADLYFADATAVAHGALLTSCTLIEANLPETIDAAGKADVPTLIFV